MKDERYNPPCYDCVHAQPRGPFRLCRKGEEGYKKRGQIFSCGLQEKPAEPPKKGERKWN